MIKCGIIGGAGYTAGELIRLLLNHPDAELTFINSSSNAGNKITDVHGGLYGETDLVFTSELPLDSIDLLFFCTAHGDTKKFMESHTVPENVKIYRPEHGLPDRRPGARFRVRPAGIETRRRICNARHIANPGCFATCIQLGVLPLAKHLMLKFRHACQCHPGFYGSGVKLSSTSHFSWRTTTYQSIAFTHQHLAEINQSLSHLQKSYSSRINFIPVTT